MSKRGMHPSPPLDAPSMQNDIKQQPIQVLPLINDV